MKPIIISLFLLISLFFQNIQGQNFEIKDTNNIFEALTAKREGEGNIRIRQPRYIKRCVGVPKGLVNTSLSKNENSISLMGYRIQAYNGNLAISKQEAYSRAKRINEVFPKTTCYVSYRSPFWRLMVGDFISKEVALDELKKLKSALPDIATDMYIVRNKIRRN